MAEKKARHFDPSKRRFIVGGAAFLTGLFVGSGFLAAPPEPTEQELAAQEIKQLLTTFTTLEFMRALYTFDETNLVIGELGKGSVPGIVHTPDDSGFAQLEIPVTIKEWEEFSDAYGVNPSEGIIGSLYLDHRRTRENVLETRIRFERNRHQETDFDSEKLKAVMPQVFKLPENQKLEWVESVYTTNIGGMEAEVSTSEKVSTIYISPYPGGFMLLVKENNNVTVSAGRTR